MPRSPTDRVPTRVSARRRWRAKEARAILKQLDASGLSVREFAARYGLETQRLYRWRAQLASTGPAAAPPFVEIERSVGPGVAIEVVLRSGHVIRVRDGFGEDALRRVVAVLDGASGARC
jgi:transposase-like protein